ncbi:MAG: NADH-quinone oxidoreductase subunit M [Bacteroidota bacterium]
MDTLTTLLLISPLIGIPLLMLMRAESARIVTFGVSLLPFALSLAVYSAFLSGEPTANGYQFYQQISWLGTSVSFSTGIDGISIYMILLTTLLTPIVAIYSKEITQRQVLYFSMLLLLEFSILGFFMALDVLLFYIFFELVLIPSLFFIGVWGDENRNAAGVKFFLYTLGGSLLMLVAIIYMGLHVTEYLSAESLATFGLEQGQFSTNYLAMLEADWPAEVTGWLFVAFFLSFGIKAPIFPLHTWQADAYASAPVGGTVMMGAIMSKMGVYGLIRYGVPIFPEVMQEHATILASLAVIGIIYGAMAAIAQKDIKRLLAYSSLSHMGFIALGIFSMNPEAMSGAVIQMLAHGISTAGLFLLAGMIETRTGTRQIADYGGLAKQMPAFAFLFIISVMASVGLPGLSGFVGEFMIMIGAFQSSYLSAAFSILAATGVIIAAVYLLGMTRKVMFGSDEDSKAKGVADLNGLEVSLLMPLILLMFVVGLYATPFLQNINPGTEDVLEYVEQVDGDQSSSFALEE